MRVWLAASVVAGCAAGRSSQQPPDADVVVDARLGRDGQIEVQPDAAVVVPADAAMVVPPDAYQCQVQTKQLLTNPVLDLNPSGMGWVQQPIDSAAPLITADDGVAEHSPPFKAWLGGLEGQDYFANTLTDGMYQDVAIPPGTTELKISGYYEVRTMEAATAVVYDTAQIALVQTNGTPIETIKALSNKTPTSSWTAFAKTFASPHAGQTVRLRITSTNDVELATSFFFDTLALTATVCQ